MTRDCFERFAVWAWDDEQENHCPVKIEGDTLPDDLGPLFIKAAIRTASGREFDGYVIGLESYYCFAIFVNDEEFMFNMNLSEFLDDEIKRLFVSMNEENMGFFPVNYRTKFKFSDSEKVTGSFDLD